MMDKYQKQLKARADAGDKSAKDVLINSYVESLLEPVLPMLALRVKTIMEEIFDRTRIKYEPKTVTDNSAVIATLQSKLDRYEKALRFYADKKNWSEELVPILCDQPEPSKAETDCGETARKALDGGE